MLPWTSVGGFFGSIAGGHVAAALFTSDVSIFIGRGVGAIFAALIASVVGLVVYLIFCDMIEFQEEGNGSLRTALKHHWQTHPHCWAERFRVMAVMLISLTTGIFLWGWLGGTAALVIGLVAYFYIRSFFPLRLDYADY